MSLEGEDLNKVFENAFAKANTKQQSQVPQDLQLKLYAYYKRAVGEHRAMQHESDNDLRSAFKINALIQVQNISVDEAKRRYIAIIDKLYG